MQDVALSSSFTLTDVPGGLPWLGHLRSFKHRPLRAMSEWWRQYGDALRFRLGPKTVHLFSHPALAENVLLSQAERFGKVYEQQRPTGLALVLGNGLVTSSGEVWKRHRRIIQPVFHRSRMAAMADRMVEVGAQRLAGWAAHGERPVDIAAEMMQLTLEVISQTMFHTSVAQHMDQISHSLRVSLKYAFDSFHNPLHLPAWVPTARNREFGRALQFMDTLIYELVAARRQSGAQYDDLLNLLLQARDEETGMGLSDQELRDEALTIFAAGHETTANALSWTWYLLATHPEVKTRFHREVDGVLHGRPPRRTICTTCPTRAPSSMNRSASIPRCRPSKEKPCRRRRSAASPSRPTPSSSSACTTSTGTLNFGQTPTRSCRNAGWTGNGRLSAAPTFRSAWDPERASERTSPQWKAPCFWPSSANAMIRNSRRTPSSLKSW